MNRRTHDDLSNRVAELNWYSKKLTGITYTIQHFHTAPAARYRVIRKDNKLFNNSNLLTFGEIWANIQGMIDSFKSIDDAKPTEDSHNLAQVKIGYLQANVEDLEDKLKTLQKDLEETIKSSRERIRDLNRQAQFKTNEVRWLRKYHRMVVKREAIHDTLTQAVAQGNYEALSDKGWFRMMWTAMLFGFILPVKDEDMKTFILFRNIDFVPDEATVTMILDRYIPTLQLVLLYDAEEMLNRHPVRKDS